MYCPWIVLEPLYLGACWIVLEGRDAQLWDITVTRMGQTHGHCDLDLRPPQSKWSESKWNLWQIWLNSLKAFLRHTFKRMWQTNPNHQFVISCFQTHLFKLFKLTYFFLSRYILQRTNISQCQHFPILCSPTKSLSPYPGKFSGSPIKFVICGKL